MRIAISGMSGLVGSALSELLESNQHEVIGITRKKDSSRSATQIRWDYTSGYLEKDKLEGLDVLIHLAGENVASGPWTKSKKKRIYESRVSGTTFLFSALNSLVEPPKVVICASAIGFYGNRGEETLTEQSEAGEGFLAEVTKAWEAAAKTLESESTRLLIVRIGLVLSPQGGLLAKLKTPFSLGLGGSLGGGEQYMSWIMLDDLCAAFQFLLESEITGTVNMVSPEPVTNANFTKALGKVLGKPTLLPVPSFALKLLPGEMGREMFLSSQRVVPEVLEKAGFEFRYKSLDEALKVCF